MLRLPQFALRIKRSSSPAQQPNHKGHPTSKEHRHHHSDDEVVMMVHTDDEEHSQQYCEEFISPHSRKHGSDRSTESTTSTYCGVSSCASSIAGDQDATLTLCPSIDNLHLLEEDAHHHHHPAGHKHVRFGAAHVRTFSQILGDHPYTEQGCSLELGWEVLEETHETNALEYGGSYQKWCPRLTPEERWTILSRHTTEADLRKASRRRQSGCGFVGKRQHDKAQQEFFRQCCCKSS